MRKLSTVLAFLALMATFGFGQTHISSDPIVTLQMLADVHAIEDDAQRLALYDAYVNRIKLYLEQSGFDGMEPTPGDRKQAATAAQPQSREGWTSSTFGSYKVGSTNLERGWLDFLVEYENTTDNSFEYVTIEVRVYDAESNLIATNRRSFYQSEYGIIRPGFSGVQEIPLDVRNTAAPDRYILTLRGGRL